MLYVDAEPEAEPAPAVVPAEPAAEEDFGPVGDEVTQPYALNGEDDVQRFGSPAEEAEWLETEAAPFSAGADGDVTEAETLFSEAQPDDAAAADAAPVEEEVYELSEEDLQFADEVRGQSFAVAMTYWDSGYGIETAPSEPEFAWDALGWYAAWLYRTEGLDLISADAADAFLETLGCTELELDPVE